MIPNPPLRDGQLAVNSWTLVANLVGGILAVCCTCHHATVTHWEHEERYVPLHERCAGHLVQEWRAMLAQGDAEAAPPVEQPMGAYARRAARRPVEVAAGRPAFARATSASLGSPYFIPGMPEGTPWVAVAEVSDGGRLVTPCGFNESHARKVNVHRRASTVLGHPAGPRNLAPMRGYVVDPTGARSDAWEAGELASRADSAKIAG
jgi:hypothetical protein